MAHAVPVVGAFAHVGWVDNCQIVCVVVVVDNKVLGEDDNVVVGHIVVLVGFVVVDIGIVAAAVVAVDDMAEYSFDFVPEMVVY